MKKIGTLHLKSLTPCGLGWYDASLHDKQFRIPGLRSLTEWWLRALAANFLGDNKDDILKTQSSVFGSTDESSLIIFKTKMEDLSLDSSRAAEDLISTIYPGASITRNMLRIVQQVAWHPRLQLIFMRELGSLRRQLGRYSRGQIIGSVGNLNVSALKRIKTQLENVAKTTLEDLLRGMFCYINATVHIYANTIDINGAYTRLIAGLYSLTLGLAFEGLGKGSRRGFGAFTFNIDLEDLKRNITPDKRNNVEELEQIAERLNTCKDPNDCLSMLKELIKNAQKTVKELIKGINLRIKDFKYDERNLPTLPTLASGVIDIIAIQRPIQKVTFSNNPLLEDITYLSNILFQRTTFHPIVINDLVNKNLPTLPQHLQGISVIGVPQKARNLGSYVEGLPRRGGGSGYIMRIDIFDGCIDRLCQRRGFTGYDFIGDFTRRKSPLILSPLNENILLVTLIRSADFPRKLLWSSSNPNRTISVRPLTSAYQEIVNITTSILNSLGATYRHCKI
ncbi:MAG: hypothetical protein ACTSXX_13055 [Candidatus Baldrarchaeia archaeon]